VNTHRIPGVVWAVALAVQLLPLTARAEPPVDAACQSFTAHHGGYRISAAFTVDAERHAVISPPDCAGGSELLWIRPLRLNTDEYLIMQQCTTADCSKAQVVRAWNSRGTMGPYPVLSDKIPIESGVRYLLWMQRVPLPGTRSFSQIDREGTALVFSPVGQPLQLGFVQQALTAARQRGPTRVKRTEQKGSSYVATFRGGSSVWMQALRGDDRASAP